MIRMLTTAAVILALTCPVRAADSSEAIEALQKLNDFIGSWKGTVKSNKSKGLKDWTETVEWSWKIKGDDKWLVFTVTDGTFWKKGEVRYQGGKEPFKVTITDVEGKELVYDGDLRRGRLQLSRKDDSGATQEITMFTAGDGVFLNYVVAEKRKGSTLTSKLYENSAKKEGESFAPGAKKPECVVTGGLGTMAVSYNGKTYYVCCSGCRDAFAENPKKYVDEFEKKKK